MPFGDEYFQDTETFCEATEGELVETKHPDGGTTTACRLWDTDYMMNGREIIVQDGGTNRFNGPDAAGFFEGGVREKGTRFQTDSSYHQNNW